MDTSRIDGIFWLLVGSGAACIIAWFILAVIQNQTSYRKEEARQRVWQIRDGALPDIAVGDRQAAEAAAQWEMGEAHRKMTILGTWMILLFVAALVFFGVNIFRIIVAG